MSAPTNSERCPRCDSPQPHLHPAVQFEGEVQECPHEFHQRVTNQNPPRGPGEVPVDLQPPPHVIDFAVEIASMSPCRSKRGAVIFDGDDILSHGYNFKPKPFDCDGSETCKATCRAEAVHAEQMALLCMRGSAFQKEMLHVKAVDGKLVASGGPSCVQCSKLALAIGIAGVWLFHEDGWRRYDSAEFHHLSLAAASLPSAAGAPHEVNNEETADETASDSEVSSRRRSTSGEFGVHGRSGSATDTEAEAATAQHHQTGESTSVAGGRPHPEALAPDEPLHTGDDERIDLLSSIIAQIEEFKDERESMLNDSFEKDTDALEMASSVLDDCKRLDELLIETVKRERVATALPSAPTEPPAAESDLIVTKLEERIAQLDALLTPAAQEK